MSNILIVDDKEENRYLLQTILTAAGHATRETVNGAEALEAARRERPDLIISDILMPQMDGFALCRECKRDEGLRDVPFIFYTATYTDPRDRDLGLQLGAARFVVKPMEADGLSAIIEEVLKEHAQGKSSAPIVSPEDDTALYRLYNEALVRKLEDKMLALEKEITERRQAEEALRIAESRYRALVENIPVTLYIDKADEIAAAEYVSPQIEALTGYAPAAYLASPRFFWDTLLDPRDRPIAEKLIKQTLEEGSASAEYRLSARGGRTVWVRDSSVLIRDKDGNPQIIQGFFEDITANKQAERELEIQLERLRALHSIDLAIGGSMDLSTNLDYILAHAVSLLKTDAADILVAASHTAEFQFAAGYGFRTRRIERASVPFRNSLAGAAALQRQPVRFSGKPGAETNKEFSAMWNDEGFVSYVCVPLFAKGLLKGALELYTRSGFDADPQWNHFLETLAGQAAIAIDHSQMFVGLEQSNIELSLAYDDAIEGWSRAMDLRDKEAEGHTQRVTDLTLMLALRMDIPAEQLVHYRRGALLHDIGKIGVPDHILLKEDALTDEEWEVMRRHTVFAHEMLAPIRYLKDAALDIPHCHHEKWDGSGYPRRLKGGQIPLAARIFAVVDVWDALGANRPYRPAWPREKIIAYIREQAGRHFDPHVAEMFLRMVEEGSV